MNDNPPPLELGAIFMEFASAVPEHVDRSPAFNNNGTSRNEIELGYMARAMCLEIWRLRKNE